jgi:UDP-N-acetylmuramate--alanine ligase
LPGITSAALLEQIEVTEKRLANPIDAVNYLANKSSGVLLSIGAGDIDRIVPQLKKAFTE